MTSGSITILTILALAANGLLSGISLDASAVKLPARRRIGARAYAVFARGADLGNGVVVYAAVGIGAAALTLAAAVLELVDAGFVARGLPILLAALLSLGHSFTTARAAPVMLSLRSAADDETLLAARLDQFTRWQAARATLQIATFFATIWALAALH